MANTSTNNGVFRLDLKHFPSVINHKLNTVHFLEAASSLVVVVERLGTVFAPVKLDMQGNIDKIKNLYKYDENSCLLQLMLDETTNGKVQGAEGVLWLNRALLFFELVFHGIIQELQANKVDVVMKEIFTVAYEGSVKQYHNWLTQQLFTLICKMSPNLHQIMKSLGVDGNVKEFKIQLEAFNITLHLARSRIDDFFKENKLFIEVPKQTCPS